jgi:hypothetical protein
LHQRDNVGARAVLAEADADGESLFRNRRSLILVIRAKAGIQTWASMRRGAWSGFPRHHRFSTRHCTTGIVARQP